MPRPGRLSAPDAISSAEGLPMQRFASPRVAINGRFLTQPMAGVQRWAIQVTKAIDALIDSGEYGALDGRIEILAPRSAREFPLRHIPVRRCGIGGGYFWEQMELPFYASGQMLINCCSIGPVAPRN